MGDVTIGLLHPGEMGAAIGKCLAGAGHRVLWMPEGRSAATRERAAEAGLDGCGWAEMAARSEVIVSVCPPHAALDVARAMAGSGFRGLYLDANAVSPATARATSSAACGGQTETMTSERAAISAHPHPSSPASAARSLVAALRPSGTHSTRCPAPARHFPIAAPISPGCSSPIVTSPMRPFHQVPLAYVSRDDGTFSGVNLFPLITPTQSRSAEWIMPMRTWPEAPDQNMV